MRVFEINDHLTAFFDDRTAQPEGPDSSHNWADYGALIAALSDDDPAAAERTAGPRPPPSAGGRLAAGAAGRGANRL